jgi:uncharacterized protein (TIGR02145 family)
MKKTLKLAAELLSLSVIILITINGCKRTDEPETVTDIDGNTYKIVTIGTQQWMSVNLKTTRYNDGTPVPLITDYTEWFSLNTPGYCWYDNNEANNKETYGALYNWYAVEPGKLCPTGWHVPTDDDWQILALYIDPDAEAGFSESAVGGGKLKESGTKHWSAPNEGATDKYGFSALPGGYRLQYNDLNYTDINKFGVWWSSTESTDIYSWVVDMGYNNAILYRYLGRKKDGHSVRCIRD